MSGIFDGGAGGGSPLWTGLCVLALLGLAIAFVRTHIRTKAEERELTERLEAYQRASGQEDD